MGRSIVWWVSSLLAMSVIGCGGKREPGNGGFDGWHAELIQALKEAGPARQVVDRLNDQEPTDDLEAFKGVMRELLPALDTYDAKLAAVRSLVDTGLSGSFLSADQRDEYQRLRQVLVLQGQLSQVTRDRAQLILSVNPTADGPPPEFLAKSEKIEAEIARLKEALAASAKTAGISVR